MTIRRKVKYRTNSLLYLFLFSMAICSGFCSAQSDEVLDKGQLRIISMEVMGNVTLSKAEVLSVVRARIGEVFDAASAAEDARRIAQTEAIEYAYYNTEVEGNLIKLTYVVVEKNLVRSIVFKGNDKFSDVKLTKELGFKKGDYLDTFLAKGGVDTITELYLKDGYPLVEVSLDESTLDSGQVFYNINEGSRSRIKEIRFEGNDSIQTKELLKAIKTKSRKFWVWPAYYDKEMVSEDVTKLQEVFQKKGFLNARIDPLTEFSSDNLYVSVTFKIIEGSIYVVDEIIIAGNEFYEDEALRKDLKLKVGDFYSKEKGDYDTRKIHSRYLEQGFVNAKVQHQYSFTASSKIATEFKINEGERFKIGQIVITGNEMTHDKVIRRVLDEDNFRPGQLYNADIARGDGQGQLEKDVRRLVMTESAVIKPIGRNPGRKDAHVNVVEGKTGSVMLGAGVASDSGLIGQLVFDQRNFDIGDWPENLKEFVTGKAFRGAGQRLKISLEPGTVVDRYLVSFTEPYLFDKPVSLDIVGSSYERARESYDEGRLKAYVGFEKRYKDKWRRGISFRAEQVDVSGIDNDAPKEILSVKGNNNLAGVKLYVRKDTTDNRFNPSRGYNFNAGYEQVGGDHTFGVLSGTQRWYKTLHEDLAERKTILETKFHGAMILGDAPPFEKFYAGGSSSLRGFDYRGVSTRGLASDGSGKKEDPIGSDWIITANTEVAVPLTSETLSALFFVDAGTIDTGGIRVSVGTGLQILIPQWFGPVPMRFELATPVLKDDSDETRVFTFSVGALF